MDYLIAAAGLGLLLIAGDFLVRGAVNLALRLGIPALIVSLTVVAFGTSAPELVISIGSVLDDAPGLAIGNVVGSNTANVLLVLGVPALLYGLATGEHKTSRNFLWMLSATALFIALAWLGPFAWWNGLILLAGFAVVTASQVRSARRHRRANHAARARARAAARAEAERREAGGAEDDADISPEEIEGANPEMPGWRVALFLILGLAGLPVGAQLLVTSAVNIATAWGVSETVIGLTLVAVGTSLPELATTIAAGLRRQADVALGNVIGSNMFNLLVIIGVASLFGRIPVEDEILRFDLWVMAGASVLLAPFVIWRMNMGRITGAALTVLYAAYVYLILT
ncbi:calcium/sodium antiporter [Psychromarinibacter sp. C21-152]|uniref:Calcium/sodium antiporter n=1 Tax=Psychromarinibacter sediminicola TaxID=3033385 RepID=A0AAE3T9N0_9RHOB|nr:calcium/sodium antiporter [Psychromarinibacter sediminicola]MDF0602795.1 calcium/sodium antiporter [Psychromarinibacter sediminicola]